MVRGKFTVESVTLGRYGKGVKLSPEYDPNIEEDKKYHAATPSGSIELFLSSGYAEELLEPGKKFYVDFTACQPE